MAANELIDSESELRALVAGLRGIDMLAVDTEFVRERTYWPQPCLLQLAWEDRIVCVDLLRPDAIGALKDVLFDHRVLKVFHAARQDLELFFSICGRVPGPVYDTQIAGALLGFPDQCGYGSLVEQVLDVTLDKGHARTDWSRRPLRDEQLKYAVEDVLYLLPMRRELENRLAALGRENWSREMFLELTDPTLYRPDPASAWRRVKNWRQLAGPELARLQALAAWREEQAIDRDRPRKWILSDDGLIDLARLNPVDERALSRISIPPAVARRQGAAIVSCLAAVAGNARPYDVPADERLTRSQAKRVSSLGRLVDETAHRERIAAPALATRAELRALVAGQRDLRVLRGWRRDMVGERLLALVDAPTDQPSGNEGTSAATSRS